MLECWNAGMLGLKRKRMLECWNVYPVVTVHHNRQPAWG